jgi:serine/threonine protein kinase
LGQLHHPNIVAFYGVVPDGPDGNLATVTEFMVNGSLKQVLLKKDRYKNSIAVFQLRFWHEFIL